MKRIRFILLVAAAVLAANLSFAQTFHLGEMTLYPDNDIPEYSKAPKGYKPFYISHYGRHGSRAQTARHRKDMDSVYSMFEKAHEAGALNGKGEEVFAEFAKIYEYNSGHYDFLTHKGMEQHQGIAERMAANFPEVICNGATVHVYSSTVQRCIMSMASFTNALTAKCPGLVYSYDCSPADQFNASVIDADDLKAMVSDRNNYADIHMGYDPDDIVASYFKTAGDVRKYCTNSRTVTVCLAFSAVNEINLDIDSHLITLLPDAVLHHYVTDHCRTMYYLAYNSGKFGQVRMRYVAKTVAAMLERADKAVAGEGVDIDLIFGHDTTLASLLSFIGVEGVPEGLMGKDVDEQVRTDRVTPMAANMQLVFYRNKAGDVLVRPLHNEREMRFTGLDQVCNGFYQWSALRARIENKLKQYE